jgi:hypothetical protein
MPDAPPPTAARRTQTLILLAIGVVLWAWFEWRSSQLHGHGLGPVRWILIALAVAVSFLPSVRRVVVLTLNRLRCPSPKSVEWATLAVAVASTAYFVFTAFHQDRDLFPKTHDEGSYVIGLRMLARGRLWMPQHPLADFFDTFYVLVRPVYASLYFPGTALLYAPSDWLQWPTWIMPVVAAGAVVGLLYRIVSELADGAAGILVALLMVSLSWYRMLSVLVFAQVPLLLFGLLLVWAWLKWRRRPGSAPTPGQSTRGDERATPRILLVPEKDIRGGAGSQSSPALPRLERDRNHHGAGWALAMGAFAGWAAIVRPLDALCYAIPVGVGVLWDLWKRPSPPRLRMLAPLLILLGALPFLSLQLYFNKSVTGRLTQTPYTYYLERDQPHTSLGFHAYDPSLTPQSTLQQKRDYYRAFMLPYVREHQPATFLQSWATKYLPMVVDTTLPARLLVVLVPIGILGLADIRRKALFATLPLFVAGYMLNTFFLEHYAAAVIPAVLLSAVLGLYTFADTFPRFRDHVLTAGVLVIVVVSLASLYEFNPVATAMDSKENEHLHAIDDETFHSALLRYAHYVLDAEVEKPAVVLFKYSPGQNVIEEPVYNTGVAWPDDAPVIRAHDLGERNAEIFRYFAEKQPDRMFYQFDRAAGKLTPLGRAKDLAAARR